MKKVSLKINGSMDKSDINAVSEALNDLSGVVAADVMPAENMAYAYSGDKLPCKILEDTITKTGHTAITVNEEYLSGIPAGSPSGDNTLN